MYDFLHKMYDLTEPSRLLLSLLPFVYFSVYLIEWILHSLCYVLWLKQIRSRKVGFDEAEKSSSNPIFLYQLPPTLTVYPVEKKLKGIMGATSWTKKLIPSLLAFWCSLQITGVVSIGQSRALGPYKRQSSNSTGLLDVFQVSKPVFTPPAGSDYNGNCVSEVLLMDHVFAFSYGMPFAGMFPIGPH